MTRIQVAQNQNSTKPIQNKPDRQKKFDASYTDLTQPGAFSRKILRYVKKSEKQLRLNQVHSLHAPRIKKRGKLFKGRKIIVYYPGQIIQMDLVDMIKTKRSNSGYQYILMVIDLFSKQLWAKPLKNKTGIATGKEIKHILSKMKYPVQTVIFDEGKEFANTHVKKLFRQYNIHSYSILTDKKAGCVERVNRTIKSMIWKYFNYKDTKKWIHVLSKLVENYNNTYHNTIKMAPNEVSWDNRKKVFKNSFPKINDSRVCRLKIGNKVRIAQYKKLFDKGYTINWSKNIYTITHAIQKSGICWYKLKDQAGSIYPKSKYFYDLNLVAKK